MLYYSKSSKIIIAQKKIIKDIWFKFWNTVGFSLSVKILLKNY